MAFGVTSVTRLRMPKRNIDAHNKKDEEEDIDAPLVAAGEPEDMGDEDDDPMEDDWVAGDEEEML